MQERGADLGRESMGQVIREHSLMESEDLKHKNEVRHHFPWCFLVTSLCTTRIAYLCMVNTQSLVVCVIGIRELQVKGFLKCQLKGSKRSFPLHFLWVVGLHHLVKMGDPWPSS